MAPQNPLQTWGNEKTMNLNSLILSNIQASPYFKVNLYELKTYHEVIDEIFYKVSHLEPWEKGSRKTAGQTGMCGGVRGVGAGGIVSSAFCLLYKLFTLKLTKKQVIGLITHPDSPYIRGLGFMYIRYTQQPGDLWDWYEEYLEDEEEIDVKAGTGHTMMMGEMVRQWLTKLEWYSTLFPRIPVPIQKDIEMKLKNHDAQHRTAPAPIQPPVEDPEFPPPEMEGGEPSFGEAARISQLRQRSRSPEGGKTHNTSEKEKKRSSPPFEKELEREKSRHKKDRSPERDRRREKEKDHRRHGSHERERVQRHRRSHSRERHTVKKSRSRSRDRHRHHKSSKDKREQKREQKRERKRSRSKSQERRGHKRSRTPENYGSSRSGRESSFERDLRRERERISKQRKENGK